MELKNNFQVKNEAGSDITELLIYGIVGDYWDDLEAPDVLRAIRNISTPKILVKILSDGGSVFAGLAIYNALKAHAAEILVDIDSIAASIASVIAMSGTVRMPENSFLMIHNPTTYVRGESKDLKAMAEVLDKIKDSLVSVYTNKTGQEASKIEEMMDKETWLTAREAKDMGFADEVIDSVSDPDNKISAFINRHMDMKRAPMNTNAKQEGDKMEITLEMIKKEHPDIANALIEEGKKIELSRVKEVQDVFQLPGHEELANKLMFDGVTSGGEAAMAVINAEKAVRKVVVDNIATDAIAPVVEIMDTKLEEPIKPPAEEVPTDEVSCKKVWDDNAKIRDEFGDFDTYKHYVMATGSGLAKVFKGGK